MKRPSVLGILLSILVLRPALAKDTVYYMHTDPLGSVVMVTDANRNVVERTEYAPYGQVLNRPEHDGPGYTGHEEDAATGLTNMQARYDDKVIGRMLSTDPVDVDPATGGSFNRYAYASNNPYRYTDPNGEMSAPGPAATCAPGPYCGHPERGALVTVSGPVVDVGLHDSQSRGNGGRGGAGTPAQSSNLSSRKEAAADSGDSVRNDELRNGGVAFAGEIKILVDDGIIGSKGLGMLTGAASEVTVAGDTADNWGNTFAGIAGVTFQDARNDINWYVNPEGGGRSGPTGLQYPFSAINWGRVDYRPFDPDRKQTPNQIWNNILFGAHLYRNDQQ